MPIPSFGTAQIVARPDGIQAAALTQPHGVKTSSCSSGCRPCHARGSRKSHCEGIRGGVKHESSRTRPYVTVLTVYMAAKLHSLHRGQLLQRRLWGWSSRTRRCSSGAAHHPICNRPVSLPPSRQTKQVAPSCSTRPFFPQNQNPKLYTPCAHREVKCVLCVLCVLCVCSVCVCRGGGLEQNRQLPPPDRPALFLSPHPCRKYHGALVQLEDQRVNRRLEHRVSLDKDGV